MRGGLLRQSAWLTRCVILSSAGVVSTNARRDLPGALGEGASIELHHTQAKDRLEDHLNNYLEAESLFNMAIASCTVVINCAGKIMVEFFSVAISAIVCSVRS